MNQSRISHVKIRQYTAVANTLDDTRHDEEQRAEYAYKTGEKCTLLCFLQVLCAEYTLHDGLVCAPVGNVVDAASEDNHRPRNFRCLRVPRLDGIQVSRRCIADHAADAGSQAAITENDKCQNRNDNNSADDEDDAVERVGYGYGLQTAEDCVNAADDTEGNTHDGCCKEAIAAEQFGNVKDTLHSDRAGIKNQRKHGNDICYEEDKGDQNAGCAVITVFQKLRDSCNAELQIARYEEQRHQCQRNRAHGFPAHCGDTDGISLTISSYQLFCRQVCHHQRAEDNNTRQASATEEVAFLCGFIRAACLEPADKSNQRRDSDKGSECKYHDIFPFLTSQILFLISLYIYT